MATLTDSELVYLHVHLGTAADEDDLQERYDRLGDTDLLIVEVLRQRLSDLEATPAQFSVSGEYSQNTTENINSVRAKLAEFQGKGDAGISVVRIAQPARRPYR